MKYYLYVVTYFALVGLGATVAIVGFDMVEGNLAFTPLWVAVVLFTFWLADKFTKKAAEHLL